MSPLLYESHSHTTLCKHAHGTPAEYALQAEARGLKGIIFTCHCPLPDGLSLQYRMSPEEYPGYVALIARTREEFAGRIDVRLGLESDFLPGFGLEPWLRELHAREPLHHVLGSVHMQMIPYKERSLLQVFEQFALASLNNGINGKAIDTAKQLYIQLVEHCDRRGMSRNCVVASSVYAALKIVGEPRKPKEIADMFHLTTAQFTKSYKYFQEVLAMAKQRGQISKELAPASAPSTKASNYITHPLSKLPISRSQYSEIQAHAISVADKAEELLISPENMPPSLAAGTIAFVLQRTGYQDIPLERIASVCNVSEGTLQKCLKRLEVAKDSLWTPK
jgi:transcription initiation factor TFIIIB Brf1 subunit/transcription initiation factor TFIIB